MGKTSIYLPEASDTEFTIHLSRTEEVVIDCFDLDQMFVESEDLAIEQSTSWKDEFPNLFHKKTGHKITSGQCILLWTAHRENMDKLKKVYLPNTKTQKSRCPTHGEKRKRSENDLPSNAILGSRRKIKFPIQTGNRRR